MPHDYIFRPATAEQLGYVLYRSKAREGLTAGDLDEIVAQSRRRNLERGLTGCLHHEAGTFFQWLEGPWQQIFRLIDVLREDPRHLHLTVLDQGVLEGRLFGQWQMRFSDAGAASLFAWLADWQGRGAPGEGEYLARVNAFLRRNAGPG